MKKTMAWTILWPDQSEPGTFTFHTRDKAIRYECWSLLQVKNEDADSAEISKAWRRMKRKYGCCAVRVLIEVHPKYLEDTP